jgi:hypothetical protein
MFSATKPLVEELRVIMQSWNNKIICTAFDNNIILISKFTVRTGRADANTVTGFDGNLAGYLPNINNLTRGISATRKRELMFVCRNE